MNRNNNLSLGDLVNFKRGYDLPHRDRENGGIPIMSSSGLTGWHKYAMAKAPGVITGRYGTLGEVFYINKDYWPLNTSLYVQDFKGNNPKFIYYYLKTILSENFNSAGAVPGVNRNYLHKIKVPHIPEDQEKIAAILSAYDDLIENNQRRIALLEKMAEEIYHEWFVRLRFPGYQTAEFEKGIPKGWKEKPIREIFDYLEGPGIRNWQYTDSGFPFINIRLIQNGDIHVKNASFISENEATGKYSHFQLKEGDYVVSTSGTLGRGAIVQSYHLPLLLNTSVIRFRTKDCMSQSFMYEYLKSDLFVRQIETFATGAAQQNFGPMHLKLMKMIVPTQEILKKFEKISGSIFQQIRVFRESNQNLVKTKEMLLPRLISGKLSVADLNIQFPPSMLEDEAA